MFDYFQNDKDEHPETNTIGVQVKFDLPADYPFLSIERLEFDKESLLHYTGLERYEKFISVFQTLGHAVNYLNYFRSTVVKISTQNQFLLMLTKLRQDYDYLHLSRLCGVSVSTAGLRLTTRQLANGEYVHGSGE